MSLSLIDTSDLITVTSIDADGNETTTVNYDYLEEGALVTIPDNPTNGDMIKAIFGSFKYGSNGDYIHVWGVGGNGQLTFTWNWWSAPYKKVRKRNDHIC